MESASAGMPSRAEIEAQDSHSQMLPHPLPVQCSSLDLWNCGPLDNEHWQRCMKMAIDQPRRGYGGIIALSNTLTISILQPHLLLLVRHPIWERGLDAMAEPRHQPSSPSKCQLNLMLYYFNFQVGKCQLHASHIFYAFRSFDGYS